MNTSNTNSGGWNNSHMRKTVLGSNSASATSPTANTLLAALPADLRAVMKPATKYSDNTGGGSDAASYVTSTTDLLPLLSEFEYHGARSYANSAEKNYQAQYDYYRAGNSKVHYKHNATARRPLRGAVPSFRATPAFSALSAPTAAPAMATPTIPGRWPPAFLSNRRSISGKIPPTEVGGKPGQRKKTSEVKECQF